MAVVKALMSADPRALIPAESNPPIWVAVSPAAWVVVSAAELSIVVAVRPVIWAGEVADLRRRQIAEEWSTTAS